MLLPLGDDNSDRVRKPIVNIVLIAVNLIVFFFFQRMGQNLKFTYSLSVVPGEILNRDDLFSLITSMFLHGGLAHIAGNMLFLFIFGDNIEDRIGHLGYLIFYLLCGIAGSLGHVFFSSAMKANLMIPSLGASGAISGVLGGYILLFPRRRVRVLIFRIITQVPAYVALGIWFIFQLINGIGLLGGVSEGGGVAYAAHIGGFVFGLLVIKLFAAGNYGKNI